MVSLLAHAHSISMVSLLFEPFRPAEGSVDHNDLALTWYNANLGAHHLCTIFYLMARGFILVESLQYLLEK